MRSNNVKKRYWAAVFYPESLPEDWLPELQQTGLQCAISPLHDLDVNPTGEPKKPHYHLILAYSGPTTYNSVKSLCDRFNQPAPIPLEQVRGYYRYLTHQDNPEKAQYDDSGIRTLNGFNIADFVELTNSEIAQIKSKLVGICQVLKFTEYRQLVDFCLENQMALEFDIVSRNTMFFDRYLSSCRHGKLQQAAEQQLADCDAVF